MEEVGSGGGHLGCAWWSEGQSALKLRALQLLLKSASAASPELYFLCNVRPEAKTKVIDQ